MDKNLLVLLLLIPILIIGGDLYLNSGKRNIELVTLNSSLDEKTVQISDANMAKEDIPKMREVIKKLKLQYDEIIRILPTPQQAEILIKQTIPIADKWIQFTELSPMTKTNNKMTVKTSTGDAIIDYSEIQMKMTIKSSFAKLGQYLQELENLQVQSVRKLVDVANLDIKVEPNSEQLLVAMEVKTYTLGEK